MIKKISKIVEAKERIARIQMDRVEAARQKIEDVAADFKAEDLGASAKKVLNGLAKLDKHIEDKNFGLAEATIEASIKELRSAKKRIFNDAIKNLEEAVSPDEEEKTDTEDEELIPDEEVSLEEESKKSSKRGNIKAVVSDEENAIRIIAGSMAEIANNINRGSDSLLKFFLKTKGEKDIKTRKLVERTIKDSADNMNSRIKSLRSLNDDLKEWLSGYKVNL